MIRVLMAEDSATTGEYLAYLLSQDSDLEAVGVARDGIEAIEMTQRLKPDVVLMDVHMPRMDGHEATRHIMENSPRPVVMMSASSSREDTLRALDALNAGALTLVSKPGGPDHPGHAADVRRLLDTVKLMAAVKVVRRWPARDGRAPVASAPAPTSAPSRKVRAIAIGASTGGPQVLHQLLERLPRTTSVPIFIVQHIAAGFTSGLAEWLDHGTPLDVKVGEQGEASRPGSAYLAPEGYQMGISAGGRIELTRGTAGDSFCPSVSHLFRSVVSAYGAGGMGVLLTGMGRDGADGLLSMREAGALTVAQDEPTSIVFGMPREAINLGAAGYVLAPREIADLIRSLLSPGGDPNAAQAGRAAPSPSDHIPSPSMGAHPSSPLHLGEG